MTRLPNLTFAPLADSALLIRFGDEPLIDADVVAAAWMLTAALDARRLAGVDDVVPAYATILVSFDPVQTDPSSLEREIREIAASLPPESEAPEREVEIPVVYGGAFGPDLDDVASHTGFTTDEVIARHSGASYRVACGGFAPGWDYLMGLPPELATPRLPQPRTRTPPGSVGIGGTQTGVYPLETPGGWRLIGRTPLRLFDPARADPFLLHPGDGVRFRQIGADEFEALCDRGGEIPRQARNDDFLSSAAHSQSVIPSEAEESLRPTREAPDLPASIRVVQPGMLTTIQDLGRPGLARFGVAPGGALDRTALILGNRLLANDPGEAGLEITLLGPTLVFGGPTTVALTGADLGAQLNGSPVPLWQPVSVGEGDDFSFDPATGTGNGARAYLCVAGGLAIDPVLGSRSTDLVGHFGGLDGRPLRAGDEIPLRSAEPAIEALLRRRLAAPPPNHAPSMTARVVLGPQQDRFTADGIATFLGAEYAVSTKANRTGVRLTGPAIAHADNADLVSEGIAHGAIQVPGDGQPIVLLAARQTVGGYVKIATAIGADLDRFAQLRPGALVRFTAVTPDEARAETVSYRAGLGPSAVVDGPTVFTGWGPGEVAAELGGTASVDNGGAWDPAGVVEVIKAAQAAGISSFRLELAGAGLTLELHRSVESALAAPERNLPNRAQAETTVTAPVLGVFYRRSAPDLPVLVEEGARIDAGQTLALLEVMKTYHEIQAPHAGTLVAFLVEDGQFVEFGQPIARLVPAENGDG
ncbi:MAG TPA: 5-oxoprolinase subunit PxpB [Thermomicrobiales bacterium]